MPELKHTDNFCKHCDNPVVNEVFAVEAGGVIYCNLKCDKRTPVDALPQNSCQNCKNGKWRDEHGYLLWMCSKYSEYRAHKCRTDRFKEWEDKDAEIHNVTDAPQ